MSDQTSSEVRISVQSGDLVHIKSGWVQTSRNRISTLKFDTVSAIIILRDGATKDQPASVEVTVSPDRLVTTITVTGQIPPHPGFGTLTPLSFAKWGSLEILLSFRLVQYDHAKDDIFLDYSFYSRTLPAPPAAQSGGGST